VVAEAIGAAAVVDADATKLPVGL